MTRVLIYGLYSCPEGISLHISRRLVLFTLSPLDAPSSAGLSPNSSPWRAVRNYENTGNHIPSGPRTFHSTLDKPAKIFRKRLSVIVTVAHIRHLHTHQHPRFVFIGNTPQSFLPHLIGIRFVARSPALSIERHHLLCSSAALMFPLLLLPRTHHPAS